MESEQQITYSGDSGNLFVIYLVNIVLICVTFGIYYFWGLTKVRQYIASKATLVKDFQYDGKGLQLFLGFLVSLLIIAAFAFVGALVELYFGQFAPQEGSDGIVRPDAKAVIAVMAMGCIYLLMIAFLIGLVKVKRISYLSSHISCGGVRGKFSGSGLKYAMFFAVNLLFVFLTLGFWLPYFLALDKQALCDSLSVGGKQVKFEIDYNKFFIFFLKQVLIVVCTLGIGIFWAIVNYRKEVLSHIQVADISFRYDATGGALFAHKLVNFLLLLFTCFIAYPVVKHRRIVFFVENFVIVGDLEAINLQETEAPDSPIGEFDV